jgi:hypothetical protein
MEDQEKQQHQQQQHQCWCEGLGEEFSRMASRMGPSQEVQGHFRTARIEFLKGLRAMIDEKIEKVSRAQQAARGSAINID